MKPAYYRVSFDDKHKSLCMLGEPLDALGCELESRDFTEGSPYDGPPPVSIPFCRKGCVTNVMFGPFELLVVSKLALDSMIPYIQNDNNIEIFPVSLTGATSEYFIVNLINAPDCFDEEKSEFDPYLDDDADAEACRPRRFETVYNCQIHPDRVSGRHLFRVLDWEVVVIVSEPLRQALESLEDTGVIFRSVA
jgi:hypothetical protein